MPRDCRGRPQVELNSSRKVRRGGSMSLAGSARTAGTARETPRSARRPRRGVMVARGTTGRRNQSPAVTVKLALAVARCTLLAPFRSVSHVTTSARNALPVDAATLDAEIEALAQISDTPYP